MPKCPASTPISDPGLCRVPQGVRRARAVQLMWLDAETALGFVDQFEHATAFHVNRRAKSCLTPAVQRRQFFASREEALINDLEWRIEGAFRLLLRKPPVQCPCPHALSPESAKSQLAKDSRQKCERGRQVILRRTTIHRNARAGCERSVPCRLTHPVASPQRLRWPLAAGRSPLAQAVLCRRRPIKASMTGTTLATLPAICARSFDNVRKVVVSSRTHQKHAHLLGLGVAFMTWVSVDLGKTRRVATPGKDLSVR